MEYAEFNPLKNESEEPDEPVLPKQYRRTYPPRKSWKVAQWHHRGKMNAGRNIGAERSFKQLRKEVKQLYAQQHEYFYDHDLRNDYTDPTDDMHAIACSTLYICLTCNPLIEYEVQYNIDDSPFRDILEPLIKRIFEKDVLKYFDRAVNMQTYFVHICTYWKDFPQHFSYLTPENQQSY